MQQSHYHLDRESITGLSRPMRRSVNVGDAHLYVSKCAGSLKRSCPQRCGILISISTISRVSSSYSCVRHLTGAAKRE
jgi:hypothetical protein